MNDTRWTGEPMVEQCDTTDFFEKDKLYTRRDNQNRDAKLDPQFLCKVVFCHPATNVLWAIGLYRSDAMRPWNPYPVQFTLTNWRDKWIEVDLTGIDPTEALS